MNASIHRWEGLLTHEQLCELVHVALERYREYRSNKA